MAAMHQKVKDKDICYNTKHLSLCELFNDQF